MPAPNGPAWLGSIQHAGRYGLVAFVARSKPEVLAAWRAEAIPELAAALVLALAAALLGWRLAVQARWRRELERNAARALSGYRLLADNATDLIVRLDDALRRIACGAATVSIGVAAICPQPGGLGGRTGVAALVAAADQALYEAKRGGRDQVRMAGGHLVGNTLGAVAA